MTGHYISLPRGASQADMLTPLQQPGVAGIQVRYPWRELERRYGVLDMDRVKSDAALAKKHGKRLVAMVEDKSFGTEKNPAPDLLPDYMTGFSVPNNRYGYTTKRWEKEVVSRLGWIGQRLRDEDIAVAFQETALGIPLDDLPGLGYKPEDYVKAEVALSYFCDYLYLNYIPLRQELLAEVIRLSACAIGGPDVLPEDDGLVKHTYPILMKAPKRVPQFSSLQFDSYGHYKDGTGEVYSLAELVKWARDNLGVDTLFWNVMTWGEHHRIEDAYAYIADNPEI